MLRQAAGDEHEREAPSLVREGGATRADEREKASVPIAGTPPPTTTQGESTSAIELEEEAATVECGEVVNSMEACARWGGSH